MFDLRRLALQLQRIFRFRFFSLLLHMFGILVFFVYFLTCLCVYVCMFLRVYKYMCTCFLCVYIYVNVCVYVYVCVCDVCM